MFRGGFLKTIELTRNKFALVDDEDYSSLITNSWCCSSGGYAICKKNKKTVYMHVQIMNFPNLSVDHINGNTLDNRKENLRIVTHSQNTKNRTKSKNKTSKFKGVNFCKRSKKWRVRIKVEYKSINLGYYTNEIEAAIAYNKAAKKYFGKYAKPNVIEKGEF